MARKPSIYPDVGKMTKEKFWKEIFALRNPWLVAVYHGHYADVRLLTPYDPTADVITITDGERPEEDIEIKAVLKTGEYFDFTLREHARYFNALDEDMARLSRFVEFDTSVNRNTYSIELVRLYLAICSEMDVILKQWCEVLDKAFMPKKDKEWNMGTYVKILKTKKPDFYSIAVSPLHPSKYSLAPWDSLQREEVPFWWTGYNKVKHNRHKYFKLASLENVLFAYAGLACIFSELNMRDKLRSEVFSGFPIVIR